MDTIEAYRTKYEQAGIETMPIPFNHKAPPVESGWPSTSSYDLWRRARNPTNLAVIAGRNRLKIIDSDSRATVEAVDNTWLAWEFRRSERNRIGEGTDMSEVILAWTRHKSS